jgi:type VI secretion system secreted protein Hcp
MPIQIPEVKVNAGGGSSSDIYLSLQAKRAGKIKGEATTNGHETDIVINAWHWGLASATAIGSTQATARRSYKALTLIKQIDSATTALMSILATNDEVKQAKLCMRKQGGAQVDFFTITLAGARVIALDHNMNPAAETTETISIAFTDVQVEYRPQSQTGGLAASYTFQDQILATA